MIRVYNTAACEIRKIESKKLVGVKAKGDEVVINIKDEQPFSVGLKFDVVCDSTYEGEDFVKMFDLSKLVKVSAVKKGVPTIVIFTVKGAFNISYGGVGPTAFNGILIKAGFDERIANGVFKSDITEFEVKKY